MRINYRLSVYLIIVGIVVSFFYLFLTNRTDISAASMIAEYFMDEGQGSVISDSSGNNNNGTLNGATWTAGKFGNGLAFDGVNDYVDLGNSLSLNPSTGLSIAAWVNTQSTQGSQFIVAKDNLPSGPLQYYFRVQGGGAIRFGIRANNSEAYLTTPQNVISANTWYHVVGVYDGSAMRVYVNGAQSGSTLAKTGSMVDNGVNTRIGNKQDGALTFRGQIDEVKIFDYGLSAAEVATLYTSNTSPTPTFTPTPSFTPTPTPTITPTPTMTPTPTITPIPTPTSTPLPTFSPTPTTPPDTIPPVISAVTTTNVSSTTVTLVWVTDEAATSQIVYGTTTSYGQTTPLDSTLVINHSLTLTGLTPNTLYHYQVQSKDASDNLAVSADFMVMTLPISANLVGDYHLDEGSGTAAADSSGNGNNGTLLNSPVWVVGKTNNALQFDGINDYVDIGNASSLNPANALSIAAWIKPTGVSSSQYIVGKDNLTSGVLQYFLRLQAVGSTPVCSTIK